MSKSFEGVECRSLGCCVYQGNYILMLPEHVEEVRTISADHVPDLSGHGQDQEEGAFKVPDDLSW